MLNSQEGCMGLKGLVVAVVLISINVTDCVIIFNALFFTRFSIWLSKR